MRRILSVLAVTAVMLAMMVTSLALPASAQEAPPAPSCGWYYNTAPSWDPWWEYWCWLPGWGWEFVFWTWA